MKKIICKLFGHKYLKREWGGNAFFAHTCSRCEHSYLEIREDNNHWIRSND